jgi:hypothetical protein
MAGFQFERDLPHQSAAVEAVVLALESIGYNEPQDPCQNRLMDFERNLTLLANNIRALQKAAGLNASIAASNAADLIFDVSMETGTGKTYAYTKTIFELNKQYGLFKFIIAVPRVAIKAGTVGFLTSEAAREHFKHEYGKELKVYEVQSVKKNKGKKESMPASIVEFYQADVRTSPKTIQILKSEAYKAGYKSIYDITAERIKRAAVKIKAAHPEAQCDFGFKQFETVPVFEGYLDEPDDLTPELELFNANKLSVRERHSLMLTWQAQDGIALNTRLTPLDLDGYTAYQGGRLVYFIEPDLTLNAIVAFLERLDNDAAFIPNQLVVLGYLLDSKTQREMTEAVKQYNNRKGIELTLDVRF